MSFSAQEIKPFSITDKSNHNVSQPNEAECKWVGPHWGWRFLCPGWSNGPFSRSLETASCWCPKTSHPAGYEHTKQPLHLEDPMQIQRFSSNCNWQSKNRCDLNSSIQIYIYVYIHTLSIHIYIYTFIPHTRHTPKLHVRQQVYKQVFLDFIELSWVGWLLRHWSESGLSIGSPCFAPMVTSMAITDGKNSCDMLRQIATDVVGWEVPRGFMLMMAYEHILLHHCITRVTKVVNLMHENKCPFIKGHSNVLPCSSLN